MKEEYKNYDLIFRRIAFVLLVLVISTLPIMTIIKKINTDQYNSLIVEYGASSDEVKNFNVFSLPDSIYKYNSFLCVISIILQIVYFSLRKILEDKKGASLKSKLARNWPCLLLAFFMVWTSVGCIQAAMEMEAEIQVNRAQDISKVPQRIIDIANWSSGDRMANTNDIYQNARDRAWNGCNNLKDGYFSFMFYATVLLNIIMLGNNKSNARKWVLRSFLISSLIMAFFQIIGFFSPFIFQGTIFYNRNVFNNSNHYGYYITVVLIMSLVMAMTEKNWYFKGLALINTLLYIPILIINNTFGAYLGVAIAFIFTGIVALIRLISRRRISEFVIYAICFIVFIACTNTITGVYSSAYSLRYKYFVYSNLDYNFGNKTYRISLNTISSGEAISGDMYKATIQGNPIRWGNQFFVLKDTNSPTLVGNNFAGLIRDIKTIFKFYSNDNPSNSGESKTSDTSTTFTKEDLQEKMNEIIGEFKHKSGESYEEYFAVEEQMQNKLNAYLKENDLLDKSGNLKNLPTREEVSKSDSSGNTNKSGLTTDVSKTGSGRGEVWIRSLDLMNQRPWFGWGLENILNEFYNQFGINEGRTHNLVLQLGATVGIPGVLIYLVATIGIWLRVIYDVKLRKYDNKAKMAICVLFIITTILLNVILNKFTDKLLINGLVTVGLWAILYACVFIKNVRLRVKDWNEFEYVASAVFVSYMISSLFGNSAFYTSPYFMIFLGLLTYEMLNKVSRFEEEKLVVAEGKNIEKTIAKETPKEEVKALPVKVEPVKGNISNNNSQSISNNAKTKKQTNTNIKSNKKKKSKK